MCLQPSDDLAIPEQTAQVARAVSPDDNWCMLFRDQLGTVFRDEQFAGFYPRRG